MANIKKLTILHSNDLHGDFLSKGSDENLIGGVSMLSGYINKVRQEEQNVIYAIAGDMFQGSIIDAEYKGISTIEIMNLLAPDVVSLGNHEMDYGVSHLLFLEKCAKFPIISANIYITLNHVRLFKPHHIIEIGGVKVLFIGIVTEEILTVAKKEAMVGTLLNVVDAAEEIGRICNTFQTEDIDFTVVLTHIGIENDRKLAALLDQNWGIDIIIGGHSHTLLEKPEEVNGIPIVQAATGTGQIGRFDIEVDADQNRIHNYTWQLIPINAQHCPRDISLEELIYNYKERTDGKYSRVFTRSAEPLTHPSRKQETTMGNVFSDILRNKLGLDIMLFGSGSFRKQKLPTIITHKDLAETLPYDEAIYRLNVTGEQFRRMMKFVLREEAIETDEGTQFYQLSDGVAIIYDRKTKDFTRFEFKNKPIGDSDILRIGLQEYQFKNLKAFLDIDPMEISQNGNPRVVSTSEFDIIEEWLCETELIEIPPLGRLIIR